MRAALLALLFSPAVALADSTITGDGQVTGQVGIGTQAPQARLEVRLSSTDAYGLKISSPNGQAMLLLDGQDRLGVGVAAPAAGVDVRGIADSGDLGLLLRVGNSSSSTSSSQLVFGYSGGTYRHRFETRAAAAQNIGNGMDFFLWHATADPAALGNFLALSLEAGVSGSTASFHVLPFGIADAEVEVSNSVTTGGGSIEYGTAGTHSARRLKSRIEYLENAQGAYDDVKGLKHARFRYRGGGPALRGLIYGDAPEGVRGPGKTVVLDYRVLELEMALQVAGREIQRLESRVAFLEKSHAH